MEKGMPLISIIIPVYNVELYLKRCVDSVLSQTYTNIEVILIDDGSVDYSGKICDAYEAADERIRVIHKKNGGTSSARNSGLQIAKGEYIGFVDSDDYIAEDMYYSLFTYMQDDVDITCCDWLYVPSQKTSHLDAVEKFSQEEAMAEVIMRRKINTSVCTKLFRRSLFDRLSFQEGTISEDVPMLYNILKQVRNVMHIGERKYFYCYREESKSNREFYLGRMDYLLFKRDICVDVKINYPRLIMQAEAGYIQAAIYIIGDISKSSERKKYQSIERRLKKMLRNMLLRGLRNPYIEWGTVKAMIILGIVDKG